MPKKVEMKHIQISLGDKENQDRERIEKKIDELKENVDVLNETLIKENDSLRNQMKIVLDVVSEQNIAITQLLRNHKENALLIKHFPVTSEDSLQELDAEIEVGNRNNYIKVMKTILKPDGVTKNLNHLFSDEFIEAFNIKGNHGKKSLNQFKSFYAALLDSIVTDGTTITQEEILRKAIQLNKNRLYKKHALKRKHEESRKDEAIVPKTERGI